MIYVLLWSPVVYEGVISIFGTWKGYSAKRLVC